MLTGKQNKLIIKDVVREAFQRLGGADWLVAFATESPENARTFVQLVARLIPTEITGKDGAPLSIVIRKEGEGMPEIGRIFDNALTEQEQKRLN